MKISIITATLNRAHTLEDTIKSVLAQDYQDYEYIIVDGKSEDNTVELIKKYEPLFAGRLKWISEKDRGLYDGINKGIRMSTGDVVGIINSDDFFHNTNTFSVIADAFKDNSVEVIFGDIRVVNPSNLKKTVRFVSPWYFKPWMFRYGVMPPHATFYAQKKLFEKFGYYKLGYKITADFDLLVRFMMVNHVSYKYVPHTFLTFRNGGISSKLSNKMTLNKEIVRACKENHIWTCLPLIYVKYIFRLGELLFCKDKE